MAQQASAKAVSQFPLPPHQYYRDCANAPPSPPPPPPSDSYSMFGRVYTTDDTLPSLEEAGRKQLYDPAAPPCTELRRLNRQLLTLFMTLVRRLCEPLPPDAPPQPHRELVQEIEDSFINMQHLINVMRPAQAAMDVKILLERQTAARKEMTEKLKESVKRAWDLIGGAAEKLAEPSAELSAEACAPLDDVMDTAADGGVVKPADGVKKEKDGADGKPPLGHVLAEITQIMQDPTL